MCLTFEHLGTVIIIIIIIPSYVTNLFAVSLHH